MPGTTTLRANRYPASTDPANVPSDIQNLATDLDNTANIYTGTLGTRPAAVATAGHAAANPGSFYYATDTAQLFINIAGAWIELTLSPGIPIGSMVMTAATGDPADTRFLLADGRALARAGQYAPLFAAIGTAHGAGDGSTTFNIPDKRGRTTVGADNMGTAQGAAGRLPNNNRALGQNGGEERHTLSTVELATHNHGVTDPTHNHGGVTGNGLSSAFFPQTPPLASVGSVLVVNTAGGVNAPYANNANPWTGAGADHNHGISASPTGVTVNNNGSGTPHNNLQPYEVDNFLIRVK